MSYQMFLDALFCIKTLTNPNLSGWDNKFVSNESN